jgi:hypothetical protein
MMSEAAATSPVSTGRLTLRSTVDSSRDFQKVAALQCGWLRTSPEIEKSQRKSRK